jgi:hypothetical protein
MQANGSEQVSSKTHQHNQITEKEPSCVPSSGKTHGENTNDFINIDSCGKQSQIGIEASRRCSVAAEMVSVKQVKSLKPPWK